MNPITRRHMLSTAALMPLGIALAGCMSAAPGALPPIPISVSLPPEVIKFLTGVNDVIAKVEGSGAPGAALDLIAQAKAYIAQVRANPPDLKAWVGYLATPLSALSGFLPIPYSIAGSVLAGLMKAYAGIPSAAARRGMAAAPAMSLDEALVILAH